MKVKLKTLRLKNNMLQKELASKVGISKSYYSQIENEKCTPSLKVLCKLCEVLNCTLNDIIE